MQILNLTQHQATPEQVQAGVIEPKDKKQIQNLLTFTELPTPYEVGQAAEGLARLAEREGVKHAMIGGAPYLMGPLEQELRRKGIDPLYAFSTRESRGEVQPDGSIKKVAIFRHKGFVKDCTTPQ